MRWVAGDLQGCDSSFEALLRAMAFDPARDQLFLCGDLVNRGPGSLATLRRIISLGPSVQCVLGNHDLNLLAVACGVRKLSRSDTVQDILGAADRQELIDWLRHRPLACEIASGHLMVHAGLLPSWSASKALHLAAEVEEALRGPDWASMLAHLYGDAPAQWSDNLTGHDRLRVIVNGLTRLRFCTSDGIMDLKNKAGPGGATGASRAWFLWPDAAWRDHQVYFGHWSTAGLVQQQGITGLDTGCVWGGHLTAVEVDQKRLVQVTCRA